MTETLRRANLVMRASVAEEGVPLVENAIGKAKQLLKVNDQPVPVSGYEAFKALASSGQIEPDHDLRQTGALNQQVLRPPTRSEWPLIVLTMAALNPAFLARRL